MRIFIGIDFAVEIKEKLAHLFSLTTPYLKFYKDVRKPLFHLTLYFIGSIDPSKVKQFQHCLTQHVKASPFSIDMKGLNTFKKHDGHILYASIAHGKENLIALNEHIQNILLTHGLIKQKTSFHPHVTLARKVTFIDDDFLALDFFDIKKVPVSQVTIFLSHQVDGNLTYTPLHHIHLKH